ncbi:hypothetical protein [Tissierella creatinophila]|uniref:TM2 domain protein n=1 Tax=Tissierella creatinophila DSM 6911 TaxID=1123403 RepID=A0A1U7M8C8_TISCR|nr:hypothetical protein [Tissierella creatinophila]OLS03469.1 hypothetical protein TICRE_04630 [Tissierella creatinophila DSM 6911]
MRGKSKFITFLLSFIPGMSHFYIGYGDRGLIYLILTVAIFVGSLGLSFVFGDDAFILIFIFSYPIIWLISLIDAFSVINKLSINATQEDHIEGEEKKVEPTSFLNKKMITLALSIVPGAGHMYLGQQKKGLSFMSIFFFTIFFMGWLRLNFLIFLLPVIWFYVFFDAFHLVNGEDTEDFDIVSFLPKVSNSLIGKILIGIGIIIFFNNIFYPIIADLLDYRFVNYIQTSIVAIIFIVIGIKMLKTKKEILRGEEDEN